MSTIAKAAVIATAAVSLLAASSCRQQPTAPNPPPKLAIATVDMQKLFKEYYKTNEAQKEINVERSKIQKDNNERLARIRELETELGTLRKQLEDPNAPDSRRQALHQDWQKKQQEGIALDRERREFLERRNQSLNEKMVQRMKLVLEEISKIVIERSKADKIDYVFDKSALSTSQVPFLMYAGDAIDITDAILKEINKDAPAGFQPPGDSPSPEPANGQ